MQDQHDPRIGEGRGDGAIQAGDGGGGSDAIDSGGRGTATVLSLAQGLGLEFVPLSSLQFLDAPDIARCGAANRFLYKAGEDEGVWQAARDRLWEGKVFVPESSRAMRAKEGYIASLRDSTRTWLLPEELTSFSWWFRFKQQAGEAWTAQDPWYRNEKAPTVDFKLDHTVLRHGDMSLPPAASINWRFVERTGRRTGPKGSFLRVSIGGREVPTYIVSRHPSNWGFLLESCWTVYTSWEMPPRDGPGCDRSLLDDELTVTMDDQWEEAMSFNTGLSFEIYDHAPAAGDGDDNDNDDDDDNDDNDAENNNDDDNAADQEVEMIDVVPAPPAAEASQQPQHPDQGVPLGAAAAAAAAVAAATGAKVPLAAAGFPSGGSDATPVNGKQSPALVEESSAVGGGGNSSGGGGGGAGAGEGRSGTVVPGSPPATSEGSK